MTDTLSLVQRLEGATEGSRDLDAQIEVINWSLWSSFRAIKFPRLEPDEVELAWSVDGVVSINGVEHEAPQYTTSLDAKLPWENIEQVALHDVVEGEPLGEVWEAWHVDPETRRRTMGAGWTEAIARRVAALKARETKEL